MADQFPDDGQNAFAGRSASEAEKTYDDPPQETEQSQQDAERQRATERDTTRDDSERVGPATGGEDAAQSGSGSSDPNAEPSRDSDADTTAGEETVGEQALSDDVSESEEADASGDSEAERPEDTSGDVDSDSEEAPTDDGPPVKYHGTEPEDEEYEDYVFISEVDPNQRYETVEDWVNSHEELLQHTDRQQGAIERLQNKVTTLQAEQEGKRAELEKKVSMYEDHLSEDQLADALADQYMPEEFQGLQKEDVPAERQEEYIKAKAKAEMKAEEELEATEEARASATEQAKEKRQRIQDRGESAQEFLESVTMEDLGLDGQDEPYVREALSELTVEGEQGERNAFDVAYFMEIMKEFVPEELNIGEQDLDMVQTALVDHVGALARQKKREAAQNRADKVQRRQEPTQASRASTPEPASQESAGRKPGTQSPAETFRQA